MGGGERQPKKVVGGMKRGCARFSCVSVNVKELDGLVLLFTMRCADGAIDGRCSAFEVKMMD